MNVRPNENAKIRKKVNLIVVMIVLVTLIPTFFTGFVVGKSYAANTKNIQQDVTGKVLSSSNQGEEQEIVKDEYLADSVPEANTSTELDSTEEIEVPVSQDQEENDEVAGIEEASSEKIVYLTFDDGPSKLTEQFLNVLHEHDIKATFFMQGNNLKKEHLQESVKRASKEGHYIGGHSMTHDFNLLYKDFQFVPEMNETLAIIQDITGISPNLVRPPYGSAPGLKSEQIRNEIVDAGIKVWDWTIDSYDWKLKGNPTQITQNIISGTNSDREVVLLHEHPQSLAALPDIIAFYKEQGYKFVVYDEDNHFDLNFQNDARL